MKALSVCATYGRLPYLGRMLSSFLHQTYDDKHLVIVNDDKNIELKCDNPQVSILNCSNRMIIGEKRNLGSSYGFNDVIFPWDDDDVFLPNRISNHISQYSDPYVRAYRNTNTYIIYGDKFNSSNGTPNDISFLKNEWFDEKGYQEKTWEGEDAEFHQKLKGFKMEDNPKNRDFVYCFGGINYHLSCNYGDEKLADNIEQVAYNQLQDLNLVGKKFWIEPDFEQYNNFMLLDKIYKEKQQPLLIKHIGDAKIDISDLL